ncbi:MAG TPA: hypothetical protein VFN21_10950 [Acidimicrobiales bacterium]|nr:hypothetical protein [Acidimicrobiales bacterium]
MTSLRRTRSGRAARRARLTTLTAAATLIAASLFAMDVGDADEAEASHFRANQTTWVKTGTDTVRFTLTNSWRASYYPVDEVGDTFDDGTFDFGDGTDETITWEAIAIDSVNDIVTATAVFDHTYATTGPFWAAQDNCCRLGSGNGHINNSGGNIHMRTYVDLSQPSSLSSAVSPIVGCPADSVCNFTLPASNPTSGTTSFRLAGAADGFNVQPPGASVDPVTGLYTWDTTGVAMSADPLPTFYSTQVIVESWDGQTLTGSIAVDFFLQVGGSTTNQAPIFVAPTPADGVPIEGSVGVPLTFTVAATDADDDHIVLGIVNLPAGATFTQTVDDHGSATGEFTWTPTAVGDTWVILTAMDSQGLSATQRLIPLHIGAAQSTTTPAPTTPDTTTPPPTDPPPTNPPVTSPTTVPPEVPTTTTAPVIPTTVVPDEPTTTVAETTTTADPTTTVAVEVSPQTTQQPPAKTEAAASGELARTGSNVVALGLLGLGLALAGAVAISSRRRLS